MAFGLSLTFFCLIVPLGFSLLIILARIAPVRVAVVKHSVLDVSAALATGRFQTWRATGGTRTTGCAALLCQSNVALGGHEQENSAGRHCQ